MKIPGIFVFVTCLMPVWVATPAQAQSLNHSQLFFDSSGTDQAAYGANEVITISGNITYYGRRDPKPPGNDALVDYAQPVSDIYLVPHGTHTGGEAPRMDLTDVNGAPNSIFGFSGGSFIEQPIGTTMPSGALKSGEYDVVIDEHQDGAFQSDFDLYAGYGEAAIVVNIPFDAPVPPATGVILLKLQASQQMVSAAGSREAFKAFKNFTDPQGQLIEAYTKFALGTATTADFAVNWVAVVANPVGLAIGIVKKYVTERSNILKNWDDYVGMPLTLAENVLENRVKRVTGMAADPPDPNFAAPVVLAAAAGIETSIYDPLGRAWSAMMGEMERSERLSAGLLSALEKYQGAQAVRQGYWVLAHAKECRHLAMVLANQMEREAAAMTIFRTTLAAHPFDLDALATAQRLHQAELASRGFSAEEKGVLAAMGVTGGQAEEILRELLAEDHAFSKADALTKLDNDLTSLQAGPARWRSFAATWDAVIATILTEPSLDRGQPLIALPATVSGAARVPLSFTALVSQADALPLTVEWDFDEDGAYDDAAGPTVQRTWPGSHSGLAGARVTSTAGRVAYAWVMVTVTDTNRRPAFNTLTPLQGLSVSEGLAPLTFTAAANDPDGDAVQLSWTLDNEPVSTGGSFTYTPTVTGTGHVLRVTASDGKDETARTWIIAIKNTGQPALADLSLKVEAPETPVQTGAEFTWKLTVENHGPGAAANVVIAHTQPVGLTFVRASTSFGTSAYSAGTVRADLGTLAAGGTATVWVQTTAAASGTYQSGALASSDSADFDTSNNSVSARVRVNAPSSQSADLSPTAEVAPSPAILGGTQTITFTTANAGPDGATELVLETQLPESVAFVTSTPAALSSEDGLVRIALPDVASGASTAATVVVRPTLAGTGPAYAQVFGAQNDAVLADNQTSVLLSAVAQLPPTSDLILTQAAPAGARVSLPATWLITVKNNGPDAATNVSLFDILPAGARFTGANPAPASLTNGRASFTLGTLANGASRSVTVTAAPQFAGEAVNRVIATSDSRDANGAESVSTVTVLAAPTTSADLSAALSAAPPVVLLNGQVTLTLTLANAGPNAATAVTAVTRLPEGLTFVSATGGATHSNGAVTASVASLASGAQAVFTITATAQAARSFAVLSETHSGDLDPSPANNRATAGVTVQNAPPQPVDLAVTQTARSSVFVGDAVKVILTVTNRGPGGASAVTLSDSLPAQLSFGSAVSDHGTVTHNAGVITAALGRMAVNESATVELILSAQTPGLAVHTVSGVAAETESTPVDNTTSLGVTVLPVAPVALRATYRFDDTLAACEPGVPPLVAIDPGDADTFSTTEVNGRTRRVYRWNGTASTPSTQAGLKLNTAGLLPRDNYSVEMVFRFTEADNRYRAIIHTANREGDHSLYVSPANRIMAYPLTEGTTPFVTGQFHHLALTVGPDGTVTTWLDGILQRTDTTAELNISSAEVLNFFVDNDQGPAQWEFSNGEIALMRIYEGVLPPNRISAQAKFPFGPDVPMHANADLTAPINPIGVWTGGFSTERGTPFLTSTDVRPIDTRWFFWEGTANGPFVYRSRQDQTIASQTIRQPADLLGMDPSLDGRNAVLRWTAPSSGLYRFNGRFQGIDVSPNGTDVALLKNGDTATTLFEDYVLGFEVRKPFDVTATLAMGETVDFSVGRGGNSNLFDSTGLDAVVTALSLTDDCAEGTDLVLTPPAPATYPPGATIALHLTAANAGLRPAPRTVFTGTIPAGLTFLSATGGTATVLGSTVSIELGTIPPGETRGVSLLVTGNTAGIFPMTAQVLSGTFDPSPGNNSARATVTLGAVIPLAVTARTTLSSVEAGSETTFELVMANAGTLPAPGLTLSANLPTGTTFVSATGGGTLQGGRISFPARTLAAGEAAGYSVRLRADAPGTVTLSAAATSNDPAVRGASGSTSVGVLPVTIPPPDLHVAISTNPAQPYAGCRVTYTYTVTNDSPTPAWDVTLTGLIPPTLVVISTSASHGSAAVTGARLEAALGRVIQGTPVTVRVTALATAAEATVLGANVSGRTSPGSVIHLWDFNEDPGSASSTTVLSDLIGGAHGTVRGAGATTTGTGVQLPGGDQNSAAYIDLPNHLISPLRQVTIEGWFTAHAPGTRWNHIFSFGSSSPGGADGEVTGPGNTNGGSEEGLDYISLTSTLESNDQVQRLAVRNGDPGGAGEYSHDSSSPTVIGQPIHLAVTVENTTPGQLSVRYYRDGALKGQLDALPFNLADLNDVNNWLGRGNWTGYPHINCTFDEFRLYDRALTAAEVEASRLAGPNAVTTAAGPGVPGTITSVASAFVRRIIAIPPPGSPCATPVELDIFPDPAQESYRLEWSATPGRKFLIQSSPNLRRWINVPSLHTATQALESWDDPGPPATESAPITESKRFYRVLELAD